MHFTHVSPNRLVSMHETKRRFAVLTTNRDARWRDVPESCKIADCTRVQEMQLREQIKRSGK